MTALASGTDPLFVIWREPAALPPGASVLSFLSSDAEERLRQRHQGPIASARARSAAVANEARRLYVDMVAAAGVATDAAGCTFRACLAAAGDTNCWWFHPVSFRDSESDATYDRLLALATIREAAGAGRALHLVGGPPEIAAVLCGRYAVVQTEPAAAASKPRAVVRGLLSRARMVLRELRHVRAARGLQQDARFDVGFSAFWDWSVGPVPPNELVDRYFRRLPDCLRAAGRRVGWLAWLDPETEPGKQGRHLDNVIAPARERSDVVILQRDLRPADVFRAYSDFRPWRIYGRFRQESEFRAAFVRGGLNYFPLFDVRLAAGFVNAMLPQCTLVRLATERALRRVQPAELVTFLEHFPHSRAQYAAAATVGVRSRTVQHASYSHDKTFLVLDPERELRGQPDGHGCPHPDFVNAAGSLGASLFAESGYTPEQVTVTGSPRYDHLRVTRPPPGERGVIRVLLPTTLAIDLELDMIAAAAAAVHGLEGLELVVRSHPFRKVEADPRFAPFASCFAISSSPLDVDLDAAHVVIFTYSTVADEAFLAGKPVWQWVPPGFNASALVEVVPVPRFTTTTELRGALERLLRDGPPAVAEDLQWRAARELFGPCDGLASERIAAAITGCMSV